LKAFREEYSVMTICHTFTYKFKTVNKDSGRVLLILSARPLPLVLSVLVVLSSTLYLGKPAEAGAFLKTIGKVTVMVGSEFVSSMAKSAGTAVGQEAAERLLEQFRPPQAAGSKQSYQTPYGTLLYQFQGYSNGVPMYQPVLIQQQLHHSAVALTCFTYFGWCPVVPHQRGALCVCFTLYGNVPGVAGP
jgi:hypothetical protein